MQPTGIRFSTKVIVPTWKFGLILIGGWHNFVNNLEKKHQKNKNKSQIGEI